VRSIILFAIGIVFGTGFGYILGAPMDGHDHAGHADMGHDRTMVTQWDGPAPMLALTVSADAGDAQTLFIDTNGFVFTPQTVNSAPVAGTGHAHVYVNGVKVARAYSAWLHLENAPSGSTVRVTLHANDHTAWARNALPIAAEITVP
jgi:hypothetical protein